MIQKSMHQIDSETAALTVAAGANVLVAGTSIFGHEQWLPV